MRDFVTGQTKRHADPGGRYRCHLADAKQFRSLNGEPKDRGKFRDCAGRDGASRSRRGAMRNELYTDRLFRSPYDRTLAAQLPTIREQQEELVGHCIDIFDFKTRTGAGNIEDPALLNCGAIGKNDSRSIRDKAASAVAIIGAHLAWVYDLAPAADDLRPMLRAKKL
jgi:hypothetical protein